VLSPPHSHESHPLYIFVEDKIDTTVTKKGPPAPPLLPEVRGGDNNTTIPTPDASPSCSWTRLSVWAGVLPVKTCVPGSSTPACLCKCPHTSSSPTSQEHLHCKLLSCDSFGSPFPLAVESTLESSPPSPSPLQPISHLSTSEVDPLGNLTEPRKKVTFQLSYSVSTINSDTVDVSGNRGEENSAAGEGYITKIRQIFDSKDLRIIYPLYDFFFLQILLYQSFWNA
jgi:hypothetical protein